MADKKNTKSSFVYSLTATVVPYLESLGELDRCPIIFV